jgi:hypothetical protein
MLHYIEVENYFSENKNLKLLEMTKNTIILCNNSKLVHDLLDIIDKIKNDNGDTTDGIRYNLSKTLNPSDIKRNLVYLPTSIYTVGKQRIIVTVEPTSVLLMNHPYDLWFFEDDEFYSFSDFKGYKEIWKEDGSFGVYKNIVSGRYGCYEGYSGK